MEEVIAGKAVAGQHDAASPSPFTKEQVILEDRKRAFRFDAKIETRPKFSRGQEVITTSHGHGGHTRLPQYARGRRGVVHDYHGAHIFPDLSARGEKTSQHLYSIVFEAAELWPEVKGEKDRVFLDLWESYLAENLP